MNFVRNFIFWGFAAFFLACPTLAQKQGQALVDSLVRLLPTIQNDTLKARTYKNIAEELSFINTDKALYYSKLGLSHVTKMPWKRGIGVFNNAIGRSYSDKGMYDSCQYYYKRALAVYQDINDKWNMASTYNNLGAAEQNIVSNYPKATQYCLEGLKIAEEIDDAYLIAIGYGNLSGIFLAQKNYPKALDYALKGLRFAQKQAAYPQNNAQREVAKALVKVAAIYIDQKNFNNAQKYLQQALPLFEKTGNLEGLANALDNFATTFGQDSDTKIAYSLKAFQTWQKVNPMHSEAITNAGNLGMAYLEKAKTKGGDKVSLYRQAEKYLQIAIARSRQKGEVGNESYWQGRLAELQAERGDYKNAYFNFRQYQAVQDSLYSQESKNKIAGMESQREIELRDKQLEINRLDLESQKKQRIYLFVGLGLMAVIGALLYWQNQTRKRTNTTLLHLNHELDEANKVKAKFFAILSHDLRSPVANLISFLNLQKEAPDLLTPDLAAAHQQRITTAAEGLLDTMESMLLWSKSQMEHFKPQVKEVPVSELFAYLNKFFAGHPSATLRFETADDLKVVTDEDYLKIIMQNLTSNALKALQNSPNGLVQWTARQQNGQVVLAITDNAGGISEQQMSALYADTAHIGTKTGLGLHLIRDLAKAISCKISVHPTPNVGTEFLLTF
ncbi:MAG: HAMP domain-containing histidine kinase [Spirosomaceae bacterium]|nr:HAMP domain-containing histidine kinase [Spirosomataceae bacterium]